MGYRRHKNKGIGKAWRKQVQIRIANELLAKKVARQKLTIMKITERKSETTPATNLHGKDKNNSFSVNLDIIMDMKSIIAIEEVDMAMAFDVKRMIDSFPLCLWLRSSKAAGNIIVKIIVATIRHMLEFVFIQFSDSLIKSSCSSVNKSFGVLPSAFLLFLNEGTTIFSTSYYNIDRKFSVLMTLSKCLFTRIKHKLIAI